MNKTVVKIGSMKRTTAYELAKLACMMVNRLNWPGDMTLDQEEAAARTYADIVGGITQTIIRKAPVLRKCNAKTISGQIQSILEDVLPTLGVPLTGEYEGKLKGTLRQHSNKRSPEKPVYDSNGMYDWEANLQNNIMRRFGGHTPK